MNQKDVDCLNKFHNYLLNNKTVITDEKLNRALDIYFFYQQILYNLNNNIQVSQENYDLFNQYFSTNSSAFSQTRLLFNQLIKERFDEVYNFYKIYCLNIPFYSKEMKLYENLPLKDRNLDKEKILLSRLLSEPICLDDYRYLICKMLFAMKNNGYPDINSDKVHSIDSWLFYGNIYYSSFGTDGNDYNQFRINKKRYYGTDDEIRNTYLNNLNDSYAIGNYAELVVFKLQKQFLTLCGRPDLALKVKWVARDVGDGFGFDILSFDPITSEEILIEVKGTNKEENEYKFTLSANEKRLFDNSIIYSNEFKKYYVYHVFINNLYKKDDKEKKEINEEMFPVSIVQYIKDSDGKLIPFNQCGKEYVVTNDWKNEKVNTYEKKYWFRGK